MKNNEFYNTTGLKGAELKGATEKAKTQKEIILERFKINNKLSPSMIMLFTNNVWPITSVRRALTNLTDEGELVKTDEQTKGMYGRCEHVWKLNTKGQTELF